LRQLGCDQVLPGDDGRPLPADIAAHPGFQFLSRWVCLAEGRHPSALAFATRLLQLDNIGFSDYGSIASFLGDVTLTLFANCTKDQESHY
jgi:hypothetical protein